MKMFFAELEFRKGLLFENAADAGAFCVALSKAQVVEQLGCGNGQDNKFIKLDDHPIQSIRVTEGQFVERPVDKNMSAAPVQTTDPDF
jgi:hypothetical protein